MPEWRIEQLPTGERRRKSSSDGSVSPRKRGSALFFLRFSRVSPFAPHPPSIFLLSLFLSCVSVDCPCSPLLHLLFGGLGRTKAGAPQTPRSCLLHLQPQIHQQGLASLFLFSLSSTFFPDTVIDLLNNLSRLELTSYLSRPPPSLQVLFGPHSREATLLK